MNKMRTTLHFLLLAITSFAAPSAFGAGIEITRLDALAEGETVRIDIELTSPTRPIIHSAGETGLLVLDFPNVAPHSTSRRIMVNHAGVSGVHVAMHSAAPLDTWLVVGVDSVRPVRIETAGDRVVLRILPHPTQANAPAGKPAIQPDGNIQALDAHPAVDAVKKLIATRTAAPPLEVQPILAAPEIDDTPIDCPATVRHRFRIKFIAGSTAYIDGGSNAGLRVGMNLDIRSASVNPDQDEHDSPIGAARIVGIATTSAILEVGSSSDEPKIGDWADLLPHDADAARKNVISGPDNTLHAAARLVDDDDASHRSVGAPAQSFRSTQTLGEETRTRTAGRIGLDYSGISSAGSTPGTSLQLGMSFQSDIRNLLGTHWNLEGYWRGRINRHSQFQEPTIEDSLNKTYTMQLYYDNPNSRWVAGVGRLYLPWAVSLDTVDGGYFGRKFPLRNTSGVFAGSTPDLSSWHYRPNQRIAGFFTNFEGGDYDRFHYSSTAGAALTSIRWKLDRPFAFFENELSYKGNLSAYHSLIFDSPQGPSTNGIRPGAGVSHSYFTLHYQPRPVVSFDLYHNFFRDVPTAVTSIVGTGLVDKLLFQGISAGTHVRPTRYFTLYTTLGTSKKTGDTRRSLNEMFGATWNEIPRTGLRADFHYSKFDSNFGFGHYGVLSLSRQVTNRMYWNVQLGKQDIESTHTLDCDSNFVDDSVDFNLGRHSYLQSGFTYVKGETMNYRQWYMSWGYRFDGGKNNPQFVQTLAAQH
jgi:hypothetical protein